MKTDRIEFIDAYCDRWCERCAYTMRCSAFAFQLATAMCDGDVEQALELAVGRPHPVNGTPPEPPDWHAELEKFAPTGKELDEIMREQAARDERARNMDLSECAHDYSMAAHRWFSGYFEPLHTSADPILADALDVARWDSTMVTAKLHRALKGREDFAAGEDMDDDPIQNDWNGSTKVAMILLDRSEAAWRTIARATGEQGAVALAEHAARLRELTRQEFPRAMEFVRPGFDEPWR